MLKNTFSPGVGVYLHFSFPCFVAPLCISFLLFFIFESLQTREWTRIQNPFIVQPKAFLNNLAFAKLYFLHFRKCLEGNSLFCSCQSGRHAVMTHLEDNLFICEAKVPPKPAFLHLTTFVTAFQRQFSAAVRNSCHKLSVEVKLPGIGGKMSKQVALKTLHKRVSAQ